MAGDTRSLSDREYARRMRVKRGLPPEPEPLAKEGDKLEVDPKSLSAILGHGPAKVRKSKATVTGVVEKPKRCSASMVLGGAKKYCCKAAGHTGACAFTVAELKSEREKEREALIAKRRTVGLNRITLRPIRCPVDGERLHYRPAGSQYEDSKGITTVFPTRLPNGWHCDACGLDFDVQESPAAVLEAVVDAKQFEKKWKV